MKNKTKLSANVGKTAGPWRKLTAFSWKGYWPLLLWSSSHLSLLRSRNHLILKFCGNDIANLLDNKAASKKRWEWTRGLSDLLPHPLLYPLLLHSWCPSGARALLQTEHRSALLWALSELEPCRGSYSESNTCTNRCEGRTMEVNRTEHLKHDGCTWELKF